MASSKSMLPDSLKLPAVETFGATGKYGSDIGQKPEAHGVGPERPRLSARRLDEFGKQA
jgi:hypothetical protein